MTTTVETGASVNTTKKALPNIKPIVDETAKRLEEAMKIDATTNVLETDKKAVEKELEILGHTRDSLQKVANDLHQVFSAHTLASGRKAHAHWETQKPEERAPVVAPISAWDGHSFTATHVPTSVERNVQTGETFTAFGQVNLQQVTGYGRNTGQMSAVRQNLRAAAAEKFNKS